MPDEKPNISIPKPCHEDWNKMTPNEQGAFCKVCCKTVVDFTKKTSSEIKSYFENLAGNKICGRFQSSQLQPVPVRQAPRQRLSRFVYALYLVFGAFLFSSCGEAKEDPRPLVGVLEQVDHTADSPVYLMGDTILPQPMPVKGKIKIDTTRPKNCDRPVMGKPAYVPETIKGEIATPDTTQ